MAMAQDASRVTLSRKERAKIINAIAKLVLRRHINVSNPDQDYGPGVALVDEQMPLSRPW